MSNTSDEDFFSHFDESKNSGHHRPSFKEPFSSLCSPKSAHYGYIVLALLSFIQGSMMYSSHIIIGLEHAIVQVMGIDHTKYGLLYSAEMYPNVFIPLIGGILVDRVLGMRIGLSLVTSIILVSQVILSMGAFINVFWVMVLARMIMGLGTELLLVITFSLKSIWFKSYITFAMAVALSVARLGSVVAIFSSQYIYNLLEFISNRNYRLGTTMSLSIALMMAALGSAFAVVVMDWKKETASCNKNHSTSKKGVTLDDLKDFSLKFWLLVLCVSFYYSTFFSFIAYGQGLFVSKFGLSPSKASLANATLFIAMIFINLFVGKIVDLYGYHLLWCVAGVCLHISSLLLVVLSISQEFVPFVVGVINAFGYSFFVTGIWPIVPYIVQKHHLNTAYGILNCTWFGPIVTLSAGAIIDSYGYLVQEVFYLILFLATLACLVQLIILMGGVKLK